MINRVDDFPSEHLRHHVGAFKSTRKELAAILGLPEYVEIDTFRTPGGEEDWWYYQSSEGEFFVLVLREEYGDTEVLSTTDNLEKIAEFISVILSAVDVEVFDTPYMWRH
jgi:hypothetical protein